MARQVWTWLRRLVAVGIVLLVVWRAWIAWPEVRRLDLAPMSGMPVLAILCAGAGLGVLAIVSHRGVRGLRPQADGPSLLLWLRVWFQSYFYRYVPGKVALLAERVRLGQLAGVAAPTGFVVVFWENALQLAGAGLLTAVGLGVWDPGPALEVGRTTLVAVAAVAFLASLGLLPAVRWLSRRTPRWKTYDLDLSVPATTQMGLMLANALAWLLMGASFACTCRSFAAGAHLDPVALVLVWITSTVAAQVVSLTPAGLGVREGLVVALLSGHVDGAAAVGFAIGSRLVFSAVEVCWLTAVQAVRIP